MGDRGELILAMGNAGCGVRFYRRPAGDGHLFHEEVAMARGVDEDGDLVWENEVGDPVPSFEELLPHVRGWLMLSPAQIHPEYAGAVWRLVQEATEQASGPTRDLLRSRLDRWRHLCGRAAG
jgi:hypothetical protein